MLQSSGAACFAFNPAFQFAFTDVEQRRIINSVVAACSVHLQSHTKKAQNQADWQERGFQEHPQAKTLEIYSTPARVDDGEAGMQRF
jgi:hypothetical protein